MYVRPTMNENRTPHDALPCFTCLLSPCAPSTCPSCLVRTREHQRIFQREDQVGDFSAIVPSTRGYKITSMPENTHLTHRDLRLILLPCMIVTPGLQIDKRRLTTTQRKDPPCLPIDPLPCLVLDLCII
jgi:hypothetical protein